MPRITTLLPLAAASLALTGLTFAQTAPSTVPPLTTEATQVTRQAPSQPAPRKGSLAADPVAKSDAATPGKAGKKKGHGKAAHKTGSKTGSKTASKTASKAASKGHRGQAAQDGSQAQAKHHDKKKPAH